MRNSLADKTEAELRQLLSASLAQGDNATYNAALIMAEMFDRKINLPHYQHPKLKWFREIASGALSPRFVETFSSQPDLIRTAIGFPLSTQEQWADGHTIPIAEINRAGQMETRPVAPAALSKAQMALAFDGPKLRPIEQQEEIVRARAAKITPAERGPDAPVISSPRLEYIKIARAGEYAIGALSDALWAAGYERPRKRKALADASVGMV